MEQDIPNIGEGTVVVEACRAIRPDDYITSTHRGHGHQEIQQ